MYIKANDRNKIFTVGKIFVVLTHFNNNMKVIEKVFFA